MNSGLHINGKYCLTDSEFLKPNYGYRSSGFRIPHAKIFESSDSGFPYIRDAIMGKRMTYSSVYLRLLHNNWATAWLTLIAFYSRPVVSKMRGRAGVYDFFFFKNAVVGLKSNPNPNPKTGFLWITFFRLIKPKLKGDSDFFCTREQLTLLLCYLFLIFLFFLAKRLQRLPERNMEERQSYKFEDFESLYRKRDPTECNAN